MIVNTRRSSGNGSGRAIFSLADHGNSPVRPSTAAGEVIAGRFF
jgi:hypothetical protein